MQHRQITRSCSKGRYYSHAGRATEVQSGFLRRGSEQLRAGDALLDDHASDGDHRQAAVVELLVLHREELGRVRRLEPERVEAEVSGLVVAADGPRLRGRAVLEAGGRILEGEDGEDLEDGDDGHHRGPEGLKRCLLEGGEGRPVHGPAEERVELLGERVAEGGEHRDASMLQLDLAVEADLSLADFVVAGAILRAEASRSKKPRGAVTPGSVLANS